MALFTSQPTANESPDATLGGSAVTTPSNTGHASTTTSVGPAALLDKSCRWSGFQAVAGQHLAITLKVDHTSSGILVGVGAANSFDLQYSLNAGGSWNSAVQRTDFTAAEGPTTFSVVLTAGQDISQVEVRVFYEATTLGGGIVAATTVTIANIKLEVTVQDAQIIILM